MAFRHRPFFGPSTKTPLRLLFRRGVFVLFSFPPLLFALRFSGTPEKQLQKTAQKLRRPDAENFHPYPPLCLLMHDRISLLSYDHKHPAYDAKCTSCYRCQTLLRATEQNQQHPSHDQRRTNPHSTKTPPPVPFHNSPSFLPLSLILFRFPSARVPFSMVQNAKRDA